MSGSVTTWTIPVPGAIASRAASVYEGVPALAGIDARDPDTVATANCRVVELSAQDLYFYQGTVAAELMPDTAIAWLDRQGSIWGVLREQPTAAIGNATGGGVPGTVIPAGLQTTAPGGAVVVTTASSTLDATGAVSVAVAAAVQGSAGNLAPGSPLTLVSPVVGLLPQVLTVDANGLAGGTDIETDDDFRAGILARIRQPPMGGALLDYVTWAKSAGAAYVNVVPGWVGTGSVGVIVAMPGGLVPTPAQLAAIDAVLQVERPVTAQVITVAAQPLPVPVTLHLNPDTTATRAAATTALGLFFAGLASAPPGQLPTPTVYVSRLDAAISNADGETSHERVAPAADVVPTGAQLPVLGAVNFI